MQKELLAHPVFAMAAEQFDSVADFLQLPDDLREREHAPRARKDLSEIVFAGSYGTPAKL